MHVPWKSPTSFQYLQITEQLVSATELETEIGIDVLHNIFSVSERDIKTEDLEELHQQIERAYDICLTYIVPSMQETFS